MTANSFIRNKRTIEVVCFLIFTVIIFSLYSNAINGPFIFDDWPNIFENEAIRLKTFSPTNLLKVALENEKNRHRPVPMLSFAINYYIHQYNVAGYHIVNICIHIINGILLYYLLMTTLSFPVNSSRVRERALLISMVGAFIWLIHPIQTQSVSYITQRMNSMSALFFLLAMIFYTRARSVSKNNILWWSGVVISGVMGVLCKQNAAMLPVFIFLYEYFFFQNQQTKWLKKNIYRIFFTLTIIAVVAVFIVGGSLNIYPGYEARDFTPMQRLLTEPRIIFFYISQLFFPHPSRLSLEHDVILSTSIFTPFTTLLSMSGILLIPLLAYYFRKKEPIVSFSIFWFLGNHLIESTIIPLELIFEHRNYLPSMLVPLTIIVPTIQSTKFNYLKICLLIAVIVSSCFWTFERNKVWQDRLAMEADNVQKAPLSARAHTNYAKTLFTINEKSKAMRHLTEALRLKPGYEDAEALTWIIKFGAIEPTQTGGHYFLDAKATFKNGITNFNNGKYKEAIIDFTETLKIFPKYENARSNIGAAYLNMGNFTLAKKYIQKELNINPNHLEANFNLGMLYEKQKKYELAAQQYEKILKINPKHPNTIKRLAVIKPLINR